MKIGANIVEEIRSSMSIQKDVGFREIYLLAKDLTKKHVKYVGVLEDCQELLFKIRLCHQ